ncbi:Glutamyl-tRNA(Gln) amidotransferase subunit A, mitochondrial [Rhizoctonia solani]|uniref:Glutamyl-tRNA(Gln) amidotransferase subunit A, mitochondrial n=1 Tax=Rhizoctonia solani TaxID=456999 RepID=A0A8H7IGB6_9AGAM|nr:Glutamyl-tRNA(Gln) amidotransferase subunit A, mitochondrial [Rhizoctonia solani]
MAIFHSALYVFQSLFGLASRKERQETATDWLKLALEVASQPEDEESRSAVRTALQTNNQEFLDYLRSALDTRSAAAAKVAEINSDGIECRAFLPGSPALWGWTTNMAAEVSILQSGMEDAMEASVYDSPPGSLNPDEQGTFDGTTSPEMSGATLRDIYAKAWELHREPLVWTPRGPGAGVGASSWTLTPVSLTMPSAHTRNRRASDASDARSSIVGMSPCVFAQRTRGRRDSDVFSTDKKQVVQASPSAGTAMVTPSPSSSGVALPHLGHRVSSAFEDALRAVLEATCQLHGLGLSLGGSSYSRPNTPSDVCFMDSDAGARVATGTKTAHRLSNDRTSSATLSRQGEEPKTPLDNSKQLKLRRPGVNPLQRVQASLSKRIGLGDSARRPRTPSSPQIERIISGAYNNGSPSSRGKSTPLRRVQSVAMMALSGDAQIPRMMANKVPLLGPVPATKQALNNRINKTSVAEHEQNKPTPLKRGLYQTPRLAPTPISQPRPRTPSTSRIPRPASRASTYLEVNECQSVQASPCHKSHQLPTPTSMARRGERAPCSGCQRSTSGAVIRRVRSQTKDSPMFTPERRFSLAVDTESIRTRRMLGRHLSRAKFRARHSCRFSSSQTQDPWNAFTYRPASPPVSATQTQGPLSGKPIAVKDNICTSDMPTTCSSKMLQEFCPPYDATCVGLLRRAGGVIVGKTNCDEFGMGSLNTHSAFGPVKNPFKQGPARSAGGSSGGSAAAVAANLCFAALGTDTGGSIRLPAAYCGVVGFKPSYGMISRWGVVSYADSLDCVGVLASKVEDAELVYDVLSQYDPRDPTSIPPDLREAAKQNAETKIRQLSTSDDLSGVRIGIPQEYFPKELDSSSLVPFRDLLERLRSRGAQLVPVSLPSTSYALSAYYVLASAEASSNLARYDGVRSESGCPPETDLSDAANAYTATRTTGFGREVQKRILLGTYALSADAFENYFLQAHRVRALVRADFDRVFGKSVLARGGVDGNNNNDNDTKETVDILLHPSAIRTAPLLESKDEKSIDAYVQDVLTVPASLAGLPAMSVPCGYGPDGWPVGVSVVGQWGFDEYVCRVAGHVQNCMEGR